MTNSARQINSGLPELLWKLTTVDQGVARRDRSHAMRGRRYAGFRLHQTAMYLESQTQFGDILRPREGSAGTFLDSTQPVADRVRVTNKRLSRTAHRRISVAPRPKRFEQQLPLLVGKGAEAVQRSADRSDHHLRCAHGRG